VTSSTGKPVALGDYLGKKNIVLFFYIAAFTDT
jgi:peroxiredoxin